MRLMRYLLLAIAATTLFSLAARGQTPKKPVRRTSTTAKAAPLPPLDVRAARQKVSNQLANVTLFVQTFGSVAQALEALDAEARTSRASRQMIAKNEADKQRVVETIRGLREGMVKLESEFRVKPALKKYLPTIQGISTLAGQAEDSAIAGKLVAANAPLRSIQQKLNDTLAAMPTAEL